MFAFLNGKFDYAKETSNNTSNSNEWMKFGLNHAVVESVESVNGRGVVKFKIQDRSVWRTLFTPNANNISRNKFKTEEEYKKKCQESIEQSAKGLLAFMSECFAVVHGQENANKLVSKHMDKIQSVEDIINLIIKSGFKPGVEVDLFLNYQNTQKKEATTRYLEILQTAKYANQGRVVTKSTKGTNWTEAKYFKGKNIVEINGESLNIDANGMFTYEGTTVEVPESGDTHLFYFNEKGQHHEFKRSNFFFGRGKSTMLWGVDPKTKADDSKDVWANDPSTLSLGKQKKEESTDDLPF